MPAIQAYVSRLSARGAGLGNQRQASSADFGGQFAAALQSGSQDLMHASNVLRAKAEKDDKLKVMNSVAEYEQFWLQRQQELVEEAPEDGSGYVDAVSEEFENWQTDVQGQYEGRAADYLAANLNQMRSNVFKNALSTQATLASTSARNNADKIFNIHANTVVNQPGLYAEKVAQLDEYVDNITGLDAAAKASLKQEWLYGLSSAAITGQIDKGNPEAVIESLEAGDWDDRLTPAMKSSATKAAHKKIKAIQVEAASRQAEADKQNALNMSWEYAQLHDDIKTNKADAADLEMFKAKYQNVKEAATKWKSLRDTMRAELDIDVDGVIAYQSVAGAYAGLDITLDYTDTETKKAIEKHFDEVSAQWAGLEKDQIKSRTVDYVERTGVVPKQVISGIRGSLNAGTAEQRIDAADTMQAMFNANSFVRTQFSEDELSRGEELLAYAKRGATPEEALELQDKVRTVDNDIKTLRRGEIKTLLDATSPLEFLNDKVDDDSWYEEWFRFDPKVPSAMAEELKLQITNEYIATGDQEIAYNAAFKKLARNWAPTGVNGGRVFMKHAPELIYGNPANSEEQNSELIRKQLISDMTKNAAFREGFVERIRLINHPTLRAPDGRPGYAVMVMQEDGTPEYTVDKDGQLKLWFPAPVEAHEKSTKLEDARVKREGLIKDAKEDIPFNLVDFDF